MSERNRHPGQLGQAPVASALLPALRSEAYSLLMRAVPPLP